MTDSYFCELCQVEHEGTRRTEVGQHPAGTRAHPDAPGSPQGWDGQERRRQESDPDSYGPVSTDPDSYGPVSTDPDIVGWSPSQR